MQKALKSVKNASKMAIAISFTLIASNTFAQSNAGNIVTVASPEVCAAACGRDNMCASWTFRPNPPTNGQPAGGQCQFAKPSTNGAAGSANFVQARPSINVPNWTQNTIPTWTAPNARGGNYAITPLPNYSAPQPRMANIQPQTQQMPQMSQMSQTQQSQQFITPAPMQNTNTSMKSNGASVSFERQPNINAQMQATQQQLNWRPVDAPAPQAAPQSQSPNLNAYRANDGTIDAAQMRRDQLASQNKSGQPRYSVQGEWSDVAQSVANGQNYANVDLANTTPIPQPQEQARPQTSNEMQSAPKTRGPLRARNTHQTQSEYATQENEQKKGFFEKIGGIFSRDNTGESEQTGQYGVVESARTTSLHGPLRKR